MKTRKTILSASIILILFASLISANIPSSFASSGPVLAAPVVDGISAGYTPGQTFFIDITIWNVSMMLGYEFRLVYDTSVLTATSFQSYEPFSHEWPSQINDAAGIVDMAFSYPFPEYFGLDVPPSDPPFAVARIDFTVDNYGFSPFSLLNVVITKVDGTWYTQFDVNNGRFFNIEIHDIAVTNVQPNQTMVLQNDTISIQVTVMNNGTFDSGAFDVTAYFNGSNVAPAQSVTNLTPKNAATLTFLWNTSGVANGTYTISANATAVAGETNTADNSLTDGTVTVVLIPLHDVAVIGIVASPTIVIEGNNVKIDVTMENQGLTSETINASAYYDSNLIGTQTNITIPALTKQNATFTWNTTGVAWGTYTISANVTTVPLETDTADNSFTDGTVSVAIHDINISGLTLAPSPAVVGATVTIDAVLRNQGKQTETFTVSFYYNNTLIASANVTDLVPSQTGFVSVTITWNTTNIGAGIYIIKAYVQPFAGEFDIADNTATRTLTLLAQVHNIVVNSVTANQTTVLRGKAVNITVVVYNQGNVGETIDVNVYHDSTLIESRTGIAIASGETQTLNFTWTTPSGITLKTYTIKGEVPALSGETNTADNAKTTDVSVMAHDVAPTSIAASKTEVAVGDSVVITVVVKNQGNFTETFQVTAKYANNNIGIQTVSNLAKGLSRVITFTWTTTGVSPGSYRISVNASLVTDEENTLNNFLEGGIVKVKQGSTVLISASLSSVTVGDKVTISGSITPTRSGVTVTIWYRTSGTTTWNNLTATQTNSGSQYSYEWATTSAGNYEIKSSWAGDETTLGDESDIQNVTVKAAEGIPMYAIAGAIVAIIVLAAVAVYIFRIRKSKQ